MPLCADSIVRTAFTDHTAKDDFAMVRPSNGNDEFGFDDNGLQDAFLETNDCIGWNDIEDTPLSHCETIPTGREGDESTEIAGDQGKSFQAGLFEDESGKNSFGVPPGTVGLMNDEETKQSIPNNENETKSSTGQTDNLDLSVCQKKGPENEDSRSAIRSGEVESREAKFRSERSAADGSGLKSIADPKILSSLASSLAKFCASTSWQFLVSVTVGILFLMPVGVEGELTSVPVNALVVVGKTARINCSTNTSQPVYWARALAGSHVQHWLYYGNDGFNGHNADNRFTIDKEEATGRHDVIIADVQLKDAGQYVCVDESGLGARASAELIVSAPIKCNSQIPSEGVMAYNVFGLEQDVIQISCSLTYTGNLAPTLEWSWPGSEVKSGEPTVTTTSSSVTSTLKLSATKGYNNVKFQCKANIEGATQPTIDSGLLWESETVNVRYAEFASEEVAVCPGVKWNLLCNPQCSYSFETKNDDCQCLYTYNDTKTQLKYEVTSDVVRCVKDNAILPAVLVPVAVVAALLISTITIVLVCCIKKKRPKSPFDDSGESGQNNNGHGFGEPMLRKI